MVERDNNIIDGIQGILLTRSTATELAESFFDKRPPASAASGDRNEIMQELAEFDVLKEKHDVLHEIAEAYFHFSAHILYEGGFFSNRQIHDMLLSSDQIHSRIDDSINAYELVNSAPVATNAKTVLIARNNLRSLAQEPVYLESSQLTELQMLCLRVPEAINDVMRVMGQRPFVRVENDDDKPYLQAFIRVLYVLMGNALPVIKDKDGADRSEMIALIAGILTAFYHEYLSFPSEEYLINLVKRSLSPGTQIRTAPITG
ncbi:MAG: hypothetical protein HXX11_08875 [Desulfuromonadales bacterium]|nr:hypothetical protein [Desulfuromonadales bacterium]